MASSSSTAPRAPSKWTLSYRSVHHRGRPVYGVAYCRRTHYLLVPEELRERCRRQQLQPQQPQQGIGNRRGTEGNTSAAAAADSNGENERCPREQHAKAPFHLFATCGGASVRVYSVLVEPALRRELGPRQCVLQHASFDDADTGERENFYTCAWTVDGRRCRSQPDDLLCAAGKKGVIRVINVRSRCVVRTLYGHGAAVNYMCVHPREPSWLLTASKDESVRLWDVYTGHCVAMFFGHRGHRSEVLHCDWDLRGERIVTSGMDNTVRLWQVGRDLCDAFRSGGRAADEAAAAASEADARASAGPDGRKRKRTAIVQFPAAVLRHVHGNYVDCVQWVGEWILSKSVHDKLVLWRAGADESGVLPATDEHTILHEYRYEGGDLWFMRFALNHSLTSVAVGTSGGDVYIFDIDPVHSNDSDKDDDDGGGGGDDGGGGGGGDCESAPTAKLSTERGGAAVRQVAFSPDDEMLVAVLDDGSVWQWERERGKGADEEKQDAAATH